jgi:hypothetical protein
LVSPNATPAISVIVTEAEQGLKTLKDSFDQATAATDAKGIALQVLSQLNGLLPIVTPFLPPGVPILISLGVSIVQAFVMALPAPPNTPPVPPPALHRAALAYHPK